ncbi:MAG: alpha/beta hydrolase [Planctomycetota bacterium]|nr:alpha/beta hydrolase [Planctomycetota bacterium]
MTPPWNLLLLKGLARAAVHWDRQPEALRRHLPSARLHFLDLPGVGTARDRAAPWSVAGIVQDLRARWLELRVQAPPDRADEPWAILAISLGGMVAMEWLHRHPGDFQRGVVIVSSAANLSPPWRRLLPSCTPNYLRALFARDFPDRERRVLAIITNDAARLDELVALNVQLAETTPIPIPVANKQLFAATLWRAPRELPVPVLFLGSDADHMVHPGCTPKLAARFAMPHRMHPSAGHEIPHDDPDWVAAQVADWIESGQADAQD